MKIKSTSLFIFSILIMGMTLLWLPESQAQTKVQNKVQTNTQNNNTFVSAVDEDLAVKSVLLLPVVDNVNGIYATPVYEELKKIINNDKQWSLVETANSATVSTARPSLRLESNPQEVANLLTQYKSQGLISTSVIKGPKGTTITLTFFVGRQGYPLVQESSMDFEAFQTAQITEEVRRLFASVKAKMPFRANILSRRGNEVTINLGSAYGLKKDNRVSIVQIIKINRHPKLNFMISTEKEVLGRVKLFKVEPYMSFGYVELEKDPGVIAVGSKVMPDEFVKYSPPVTTPSGKVLHDINTRPDKEVAFGEDPIEWLPTSPPQFGKVELLAGVGSYNQNRNLLSTGSVSGKKDIAPHILLRTELWLNPTWYVGIHLRQSAFSIGNATGSQPGNVNTSIGQYGVNVGYNLLLTDEYFGPKIQIGAGFMNTKIDVDASTPASFTSAEYGGLLLSLGGQFPLTQEIPIDIGARFDFYLNPMLSETVKSGNDSNRINSFSFYMDYRIQTRFKIRGELMVESYSSSFSDPITATSTSHKMSTLFGGVQYLF